MTESALTAGSDTQRTLLRNPGAELQLDYSRGQRTGRFATATARFRADDWSARGTAVLLRCGETGAAEIDLWGQTFAARGRLILVPVNGAGTMRMLGDARRDSGRLAPPVAVASPRADAALDRGLIACPELFAWRSTPGPCLRIGFFFTPSSLDVYFNELRRPGRLVAPPSTLERAILDESSRADWCAQHFGAMTQVAFSASPALDDIGVDALGFVLDRGPPQPSAGRAGEMGPWLCWLDRVVAEGHLDDIAASAAARLPLHASFVIAEIDPEWRVAGFAGFVPRAIRTDAGTGCFDFPRLALVDVRNALACYTVTHELGHMVGCLHAPSDVETVPTRDRVTAGGARSAACGWQSPALRLQTVMGDFGRYEGASYDTAPIWSEPGLDWLGNATTESGSNARGCVGYADQARLWRERIDSFVATG